MVKVERTSAPPASLAIEQKKGKNGRYNLEDVVLQLKSDFHDKCYICEMHHLQDPEVEHLLGHESSQYIELKFDWNNLFWSCKHCNGVKNQNKYKGKIIDCCREDPEEHLSCCYEDGNVFIRVKDDGEKSNGTAELIGETFNLMNTGIRIAACQNRLNALRLEMVLFFKVLHAYEKNKLPYNQRKICALLKRNTAFAAFKREYIRKNARTYKELADIV